MSDDELDTDDFLTKMAKEMEPKVCKPGEENKELLEIQKNFAAAMRKACVQARELERENAAELRRRWLRGY